MTTTLNLVSEGEVMPIRILTLETRKIQYEGENEEESFRFGGDCGFV